MLVPGQIAAILLLSRIGYAKVVGSHFLGNTKGLSTNCISSVATSREWELLTFRQTLTDFGALRRELSLLHMTELTMKHIEDIDGDIVEVRMTDREAMRCSQRCLEKGERSCWIRPQVFSNWPKGEPVECCEHCKDES